MIETVETPGSTPGVVEQVVPADLMRQTKHERTFHMLKEARIVMPTLPGHPEASGNAHNALRRALTEAFGGLTAVDGGGHWINPSKGLVIDRVVVYDVAIEADRDASWDKLFQIAMTAGRELKQDSVYIRYPDGSVSIEPTHGREGLGALMPSHWNAPPATKLGAKRLPQVGEVWRNRVNQLVAVVTAATTLDGGWVCQPLTRGDSGRGASWTIDYVTDLDGCLMRDKSSHPQDLKTYVTRFDS